MPEISTIRMLVAEDHPLFRKGMIALLSSVPEFEVVGEATSGGMGFRHQATGFRHRRHKQFFLSTLTPKSMHCLLPSAWAMPPALMGPPKPQYL